MCDPRAFALTPFNSLKPGTLLNIAIHETAFFFLIIIFLLLFIFYFLSVLV